MRKSKPKTKVFVDTNIWIYTLDETDLAKRSRAKRRIAELHSENSLTLSTQILNEVFSVSVSKLGIPTAIAKNVVRNIAQYHLVVVDLAIIDRAIDIHILEQISYWDALMLAAAISANCTTLLTEDLNHGQVIQGIRIENPFL